MSIETITITGAVEDINGRSSNRREAADVNRRPDEVNCEFEEAYRVITKQSGKLIAEHTLLTPIGTVDGSGVAYRQDTYLVVDFPAQG